MDKLISIFGVSVWDTKQEALRKIANRFDIKLGHNCFSIENIDFAKYTFCVVFSYDTSGIITKIAIRNIFKEGTNMIAVVESIATYITKHYIGTPSTQEVYVAKGVYVWEDMFNMISLTYQVKGKNKDLEYKINYINIEITDFLVNLNESSFYQRLNNARKNTVQIITEGETLEKCTTNNKVEIEWNKRIGKNLRIVIVCISAIAVAYLYAYSHRYEVANNGYAIIDKWTGKIEMVHGR